MNGFSSKDERDSFIESLKYREVEIKYKDIYYHIDRWGNKYYIGTTKNDDDSDIKWKEILGTKEVDAYEILIKEKIFGGKTILEILDDSESYQVNNYLVGFLINNMIID